MVVFRSNTRHPRYASSSMNKLTSVAIIVARRDQTTRRKCNIRRLVRLVSARSFPYGRYILCMSERDVWFRGRQEFHLYDNTIYISTKSRSKMLVPASFLPSISSICQSVVRRQCSSNTTLFFCSLDINHCCFQFFFMIFLCVGYQVLWHIRYTFVISLLYFSGYEILLFLSYTCYFNVDFLNKKTTNNSSCF